MAITDQSLEEAQARCCAGSTGAGAIQSRGREAGRRGQAQEPGPSWLGARGVRRVREGERVGCMSGRGAGRGDVGARGGLKGGF